MAELPAEIRAYYEAGEERRLEIGPFKAERARTEEILLQAERRSWERATARRRTARLW